MNFVDFLFQFVLVIQFLFRLGYARLSQSENERKTSQQHAGEWGAVLDEFDTEDDEIGTRTHVNVSIFGDEKCPSFLQ